MTIKARVLSIVSIALVSSAMSFFGYIYEAIADVPNMFSESPANSKQLWTDYHVITNPAHYHIAPSLASLITVLLLWWYKKNLSKVQRKNLKVATILIFIATLLTTVAVSFINNPLYFNKEIPSPAVIITLAKQWSVLNLVRAFVLLLGILNLLKLIDVNITLDKNADPPPATF